MKRLCLILAFLVLGSASARAAEGLRLDVTPYFAYLDYEDGAAKRDAYVGGAHGMLGIGLKHAIEGAAEYAKYNYRNNSDLEQLDFTGVYSNYMIPNIKLRAGAHYIHVPDDDSDGGWTAIVGAHYYKLQSWDVGLDGYYSRYRHYDPKLNVYQATPHVGFVFWRNPKEKAALRLDLTGYYIRLAEDMGVGDQNLWSGEGRLGLWVEDWSCAVFGWAGKQAYAVRSGGFTVYNLTEKHTGGFGGELGLPLSKRSRLTLKVSKEYFEDLVTQKNTAAWVSAVLFRYTF